MGTSLAPLTLIIIAFTAYASIQGFRQSEIVEKFLFSTGRIFRHREYYRLFTSALVHGDWMHLLFNMISFYSFGSFIERNLDWGSLTLAVMYFSSIFGGSVLSLFLHRHHDYRALGASGGVCGVIFACIFLLPPGTHIYFFIIPMPAALYAIIFLGVSIWGIRSQSGRIGHDAHLGGAMIGLLVTTILYPGIITANPVLFLTVVGVSLALFIYLYKFPPSKVQARPFAPKEREPIRIETPSPRQTKRKHRQEERDKNDEATMNRLLDKISTSGMDSLTEFERKQLEHISRRMRGPKH